MNTRMYNATFPVQEVEPLEQLPSNLLHYSHWDSAIFESYRLKSEMTAENGKNKTDMIPIWSLMMEVIEELDHVMSAWAGPDKRCLGNVL